MNDFGQRLDQLAASATRGIRLIDPSVSPSDARAAIAPRRALGLAFATVAIIVGGILWSQSNTEQSTPVIVNEGEIEGVDESSIENVVVAGAPSYLLATSDDWVVVDYGQRNSYDPGVVPEEMNPDTWAWRLDGKLVILVQGSRASDDLMLDFAEVEEASGRAVLRWESPAAGLIGQETSVLTVFDADENVARSVAAALRPSPDGWELPGAVLLAAEADGLNIYPTGESITLSPLDDSGVAILGTRIHHKVEQASSAALYRALAATSARGRLRSMTIAGQPGLVLVGEADDGSWAGIEMDGWVFSWSTLDSGDTVDNERLFEVLAGVEVTTPLDWVDAVENSEDQINKVVAAAAVDADSLPVAPELPRFVLPDGWSIDTVYDPAIWPAAERARSIAISEAREPLGNRNLRISTRVQLIQRANDDGLIPAASIVTHVFEESVDIPTFDEDDMTLAIGPLVGVASAKSARLYGGNVNVVIGGWGLSRSEFSDLIGSLALGDEDQAHGLTVEGDRYQQVHVLTDDQPAATMRDASTHWSAIWRYGEDGGYAAVTVRKLSPVEMQHASLSFLRGMAQWEAEAVAWDITGGFGEPLIVGSVPTGRDAFRYDTKTGVFVEVEIFSRPQLSANELLDSLQPIEIEAWTKVATPFNPLPAE